MSTSASIFDLPNELISKIILGFSLDDFIVCFGLKDFVQRICVPGFVEIFTDSFPLRLYENVPLESVKVVRHVNQVTPTSYIQIFEINRWYDFTSTVNAWNYDQEWFPFEKNGSYKILNIVDDLETGGGPEDELFLRKFVVTNPLFIQCGLSKKTLSGICMQNLSEMCISGTSIDPGAIFLPNLQRVVFHNCTSSDETKFFNFPNLHFLKLIVSFESLSKSFNFERYPVELVLQMNGSWEANGINFATLRKLNFGDVFIDDYSDDAFVLLDVDCVIENCFFPSLASASICASKIHAENIYMPQVVSLKLRTIQEELFLRHCIAPQLYSLQLESGYDPLIEDIRVHSLAFFSFITSGRLTNVSPDFPSSLGSIGALKLSGLASTMLMSFNTSHLKSLYIDVHSELVEALDTLNFPELRCLNLYFDRSMARIPSIQCIKLKELVIDGLMFEENLSVLSDRYPLLQRLKVYSEQRGIELTNARFPKLSYLKIEAGDSTDNLIFIHECQFPVLRSFVVVSVRSDISPRANISFEAPYLLHLKIDGPIIVGVMRIESFPLLRKLQIRYVENLILGNMMNLLYLDVSGNTFVDFQINCQLPKILQFLIYSRNILFLYNSNGGNNINDQALLQSEAFINDLRPKFISMIMKHTFEMIANHRLHINPVLRHEVEEFNENVNMELLRGIRNLY